MSDAPGIAEVGAASPWLPSVAVLFDQYRCHYGETGDPDRSKAWLSAQLEAGRLRAFVARSGGDVDGFAFVAVTPASQRLGHFWQLRDLYVADRCRRHGVGRALVTHVRDAARADGALRLSLTTEADNAAALALYADLGFEAVTGYTGLSLSTRDPLR